MEDKLPAAAVGGRGGFWSPSRLTSPVIQPTTSGESPTHNLNQEEQQATLGDFFRALAEKMIPQEQQTPHWKQRLSAFSCQMQVQIFKKCIETTRPSAIHRLYCFCFVILIFVIIVCVTLKGKEPGPVSHDNCTCPRTWIGFGSECFYFSEDMGNWTFSRTSCNSFKADLVQIHAPEVMTFLKRCKGPHDHWIGLSRESPSHSWKWTRGDDTFLVQVRGSGVYAYLTNNGVSSAGNYSERRWICSKRNSPTK